MGSLLPGFMESWFSSSIVEGYTIDLFPIKRKLLLRKLCFLRNQSLLLSVCPQAVQIRGLAMNTVDLGTSMASLQ